MSLTIEVKRFVDKLAEGDTKPLYELTPEQARQVLLDAQSLPVAKAEADIEDVNIPLGNSGQTMPVRILRPKHAAGKLPVIFYIHGGGWVMGNEKTHDRLIRRLCAETPAAVVFPVYPNAPQGQYPQVIKDLFSVLKYIAEEAENFGFDTGRLAVAGDSVGGNMATVMALMAKENGDRPKIIFQLLFYPVTDAEFNNESYNQFADGPWLTRKAMQWFWDQYCPDINMRSEITASPLKADEKQLGGLPPALIITDENDVLRDEGEAYAHKLMSAGVETVSIRFNGTIHDFVMLNALADSKTSRAAVNFAIMVLRKKFKLSQGE